MMTANVTVQRIHSRSQSLALARALGERPETVSAIHLLRRDRCRAYVSGDPSGAGAAVIQVLSLPEEPLGFGGDAALLWELLQELELPGCPGVPPGLARPLGGIIQETMGKQVIYFDEIIHTLSGSAAVLCHDRVRLLATGDLPLLAAAEPKVRGCGFGDPRSLLNEGIVAAAIIDGRVVSIAQTSALSDRYAEVAVATLPSWQGKGLAGAAASLVIERLQAEGKMPVWSTGEDNEPSLRLARKLGFAEAARRTYVIPI